MPSLGAAGSFACGVPWSLASFGLSSPFGSWFGPSFSCRGCGCGGTFAFAFFLFFGAFSCRLLLPSPFFFFGAGFSSCAFLSAVVSLSNSTASLFRLVEITPGRSFFFLVFLVSFLWVHDRPCATATERKMGMKCATCGCTMQQPTCTRCTPLAQDLQTLSVRRTTHMNMSKHIAVQLATR